MRRIIFFFTLSILIASCGDYGNPSRPPAGTNTGSGTGGSKENTSLDFATISRNIIEPKCLRCHSGYSNYSVVQVSAFNMLARMEEANPVRRMPKNDGQLNSATLAMFREWVSAGAPEFKKEDTKPVKPKKPVVDNISFLEIKTKILNPYNCTSCHSQFNDYEPVARAIGGIANLVTGDQMPFPKKKGETVEPVSVKDKDLLLKWVSQGAPEFKKLPAEPLADVELKPTWLSLRNHVFGPKCILCHNSFGNRGAGLNLESMPEIRKYMKTKNQQLINTDSPIDSHLIGAILGRVDDDELFLDPMPFNNAFDDVMGTVPAVTEDELKMIEKWIELNLPYSEDEI